MSENNEVEVTRSAQRYLNAMVASQAIPLHDPLEDAIFQEEYAAAEELVVELLRQYRNQRMISLALDEIALAVKEGY